MIGSESRRNSRNAEHSRENGAFVGDGGAIWRYVGEFNRLRTAPDQELLALCTITHSGSWFSSARAGDDGVAVDGATVVANQRIIGERIPTALPDRVFDKHIALGGETVRLERLVSATISQRNDFEGENWVRFAKKDMRHDGPFRSVLHQLR
jgi:hypothetical protein